MMSHKGTLKIGSSLFSRKQKILHNVHIVHCCQRDGSLYHSAERWEGGVVSDPKNEGGMEGQSNADHCRGGVGWGGGGGGVSP